MSHLLRNPAFLGALAPLAPPPASALWFTWAQRAAHPPVTVANGTNNTPYADWYSVLPARTHTQLMWRKTCSRVFQLHVEANAVSVVAIYNELSGYNDVTDGYTDMIPTLADIRSMLYRYPIAEPAQPYTVQILVHMFSKWGKWKPPNVWPNNNPTLSGGRWREGTESVAVILSPASLAAQSLPEGITFL